jgi:hypothetical protein
LDLAALLIVGHQLRRGFAHFKLGVNLLDLRRIRARNMFLPLQITTLARYEGVDG